MANPGENDALRAAIGALRVHGVVPGALAPLREARETALRAAQDQVEQEVDAWSLSANPDVVPGLRTHLGQHFDEIERLIGDENSPVGIDAKKTHVLILHKLISLDRRLAELEERIRERG